MRKTAKFKGGFTLTEIILVVAIILILSSAAFVGVAVTLNRAQTMKKNLSDTNGNNFESSAWYRVKTLNFGDEGYIPTVTYTPEDPEDLEDPVDGSGSDDDMTPDEVNEYDTAANDQIQNLLAAGVSRDHVWVVRDSNGKITDWKWYSVSDPVLSDDLEDDVRADIASHRTTQIPRGTAASGNGTTGNNNNQNFENYDNYNDQQNGQQGGQQNGQQGGQQGATIGDSTPKTYNSVTGGTVGSASGKNGVLQYDDNDDGSTTMQLNANQGNNNGSIKLRKNANNTYSIYMCDDSWCVCGVCGWDAWNGYGSKTRQWIEIPSEDLDDLCAYYGFTVN